MADEKKYALQRFNEGDILKFKGKLDHFAIYAGKDRIIHYQERNGVMQVIEESIQDFWEKDDICKGSKGSFWFGDPERLYPEKHTLGIVDQAIVQKTFSGPETVRRARSMLHKADYSLIGNNCEHFVTWCKYGIKASDQVEKAAMAGAGGAGAGAGAVAGAIVGGAAGSVVPIVGTAVGGIIGGIAGAIAGAVVGTGGAWTTSKIARHVEAEDGDGKK